MKKLIKPLTAFVVTAVSFLSNSTLALAQNMKPIELNAPSEFSNLKNISPASLVSGGIKFVLVIAAVIFFFVLVIGGIQWIISGGDKTGVETARKRITNALVGLVIVFAAWAIVTLIWNLFGVNIFSLSFDKFYTTP